MLGVPLAFSNEEGLKTGPEGNPGASEVWVGPEDEAGGVLLPPPDAPSVGNDSEDLTDATQLPLASKVATHVRARVRVVVEVTWEG